MSDVFLTREFKEELIAAIENGEQSVSKQTDAKGKTVEYKIVYDASKDIWNIKQDTAKTVFDSYSSPSLKH